MRNRYERGNKKGYNSLRAIAFSENYYIANYGASVFIVGMRPICGSPVPPCAVARERTALLRMPQHCGLGQKLDPHLLQH